LLVVASFEVVVRVEVADGRVIVHIGAFVEAAEGAWIRHPCVRVGWVPFVRGVLLWDGVGARESGLAFRLLVRWSGGVGDRVAGVSRVDGLRCVGSLCHVADRGHIVEYGEDVDRGGFEFVFVEDLGGGGGVGGGYFSFG
jgi:hypothetical protein